MTASPEVIAAAAAYMANGYAIVPVMANKKPLGNNWRHTWTVAEVHQALGGDRAPP